MKKINNIDLTFIEKMLNNQGYVLDFSNVTFRNFIKQSISIDVYNEEFKKNIEEKMGTSSKGNILTYLLNNESNEKVICLLNDLYEYILLFNNKKFEIENEDLLKFKQILNKYNDIDNECNIFKPISKIDYENILNLIYRKGKSWEKYPSTYRGRNEEDLRDDLISTLSSILNKSITAETYNKNGKTDILIRDNDNNNLFIAECKIWHGIKSYFKAINQLLSYLTWNDRNAALIIFVKNEKIKSIIKQINNETKKHENYLKTNKKTKEGWLNYIFHLNGDNECKIKLAVLIFHLPS